MWLLKEEVARELDLARRNFAPTPAQLEAFDRRQAEALAGDPPRNLRIAGNEAEIIVEGVLTQRRQLISYYYGGGGCTYNDIRSALALAEVDPNVRRVILKVDSPGGHVAGLLETIKAIEAFGKPIIARCAQACSAAYALAAACNRIEAENEASEFGCLGVAVTVFIWEDEITLTNSESPEKRPDPRTPEGKASIVRWLDATYAWYAEAIARGRTSAGKAFTVAEVNEEFGRGATRTAPEAKRRGMIDGYAAQRAPARVAGVRAEGNPDPGGPDENDNSPGPREETDDMAETKTDDVKALLATLGVDSVAALGTRLGLLAKLEALTGKTGEETHGVVLAWKGSHEELPGVSAKLAKLEGEAETTQLDTAIAKAKTEHRWTPAREAEVRKLREDGDCTLKGAIATVGAWGVIAALKAGADGAQAATGASDALSWNGKTYAQMKPIERAKLKRDNPELYNSMRAAANAA